jgi:hypothetical protein
MRDAFASQPALQAQRHDEQRRSAGLRIQLADGGFVQVVIVVVRGHDQVDARQLVQRQSRRLVSLRAGKRHR